MALVDPTAEASDLAMPEEGTDGHATLLLAEHLARRRGERVPILELEDLMANLAARHRGRWRKNTADPGAEVGLCRQAIEVGRRHATVFPAAICARVSVAEVVRYDQDDVRLLCLLGRGRHIRCGGDGTAHGKNAPDFPEYAHDGFLDVGCQSEGRSLRPCAQWPTALSAFPTIALLPANDRPNDSAIADDDADRRGRFDEVL